LRREGDIEASRRYGGEKEIWRRKGDIRESRRYGGKMEIRNRE
jgi:hypothetical protein